jgi:hypothetical protein
MYRVPVRKYSCFLLLDQNFMPFQMVHFSTVHNIRLTAKTCAPFERTGNFGMEAAFLFVFIFLRMRIEGKTARRSY